MQGYFGDGAGGGGAAMFTRLRADQSFPGPSPELLEKLARAYGKREEPFVPSQSIFQGGAIVDDDVVIGKKGLGKVSAVFTAVYHYLVPVPVKFDICLVNQSFVAHGATRTLH